MRRGVRFAGKVSLFVAMFALMQARPQGKQQGTMEPFTIRVTAVLVDKGGAPLKDKRVWAYPLNAKGEALIVRIMPPGYVIKVWNPVTETDSTGTFVLEIPQVTRIDNNPISEVVIGVGNPSGGLSVRAEKGIEYADPKRERENCLTMSVAISDLSLLHREAKILKIKIGDKNRDHNPGRIVMEK